MHFINGHKQLYNLKSNEVITSDKWPHRDYKQWPYLVKDELWPWDYHKKKLLFNKE